MGACPAAAFPCGAPFAGVVEAAVLGGPGCRERGSGALFGSLPRPGGVGGDCPGGIGCSPWSVPSPPGGDSICCGLSPARSSLKFMLLLPASADVAFDLDADLLTCLFDGSGLLLDSSSSALRDVATDAHADLLALKEIGLLTDLYARPVCF